MNDMERRKFEDSFQEAFKDAEVSPSENVWTNIELDLEKAEGGKMKRRLLFFQTLAAASIVFALSMAGIGYYLLYDETQRGDIAQQTNAKTETTEQTLLNENTSSEGRKDSNTPDEENTPAGNSETQAAENAAAGNGLESSKINKDGNKREGDKARNDNAATRGAQTFVDGDQKSTDARGNSNAENGKNTNVATEASPNLSGDEKTIPLIAGHHNKNTETNKTSDVDHSESAIANNADVIKPTQTFQSETHLAEKASKAAIVETSRELPAFYKPKAPELQLPVTTVDPGALLLAKLAAEERNYAMEDKKQAKNKSEKLWTSIGFAAGGFNSLNPSVSPTSTNALTLNTSGTSSVAAKQSKASGVAYSVGFSIGTKLADRWILQGGLNYLTQSSDYTANSVLVDNNLQSPQAESINTYKSSQADLADARTQKVAQTFPYTVNNNVQFVSVPVQTGYLVVNRKFGLQVNAGVSTDLFLQNTITPEGGGIDKTIQGRGDDSPYRSLNFSGLMGTELSYKIGYHYRVALNPGLRYPLNSVYKSATGVHANPLTFDVGLRFRYIFH